MSAARIAASLRSTRRGSIKGSFPVQRRILQEMPGAQQSGALPSTPAASIIGASSRGWGDDHGKRVMRAARLAAIELPDFGMPTTEPVIPAAVYAARLAALRSRAKERGLDAVLVYG